MCDHTCFRCCKMKKILVNIPFLKGHGGVVNHFLGLQPFWSQDVRYNVVGKRTNRKGSGVLFLPYDIIKFMLKLLFWRPDVVMLNPSLNKSAVTRDAIFLTISSKMGISTFVMFHGWREDYAKTINVNRFAKTYNRSKGMIVLCSKFKKQLKSWGISVPIHLSTTKVDNRLLVEFDINKYIRQDIKQILFLSRIEKSKGIFESIQSFQILQKKYGYLKLNVVGDGSALKAMKEYVRDNHIPNVEFKGYMSGEQLVQQFISNDLYLFPSYTEGMPTSVLEAMAFGLPVITRPVGGLTDFFENGKMGEMIESLEPEDFAGAIEALLLKPEKVGSVSKFNHEYAVTHFLASEVAKKTENFLLDYDI